MTEKQQLCTIALAAEGLAERCPEDRCAYWEKGCILASVQSDLASHPEVAELLLRLRRELEQAASDDRERDLAEFHRRLAAGRE